MSWTDRINPQIHVCWSGSWVRGTVEPSRVLVDHELVVVERGHCQVSVEDRIYDLRDGTFLIVPPGTIHHTAVLAGPCIRHCLHFDWDWSAEPPSGPLWIFCEGRVPTMLPRPTPAWVPAQPLSGNATPAAVTLAQQLNARWRADDRTCVRGTILELLLVLLTPPQTRPITNRATTLALRVKEHLDRGALEGLSLRGELRQLGHSYEHLCRCFSQRYGVAPLRYLQLVKIERAKTLLGEGSSTVQTVAHVLGYRDVGNFTRIFRELTGETPGRWRERADAAPHPPARRPILQDQVAHARVG